MKTSSVLGKKGTEDFWTRQALIKVNTDAVHPGRINCKRKTNKQNSKGALAN